MNRAVVTSPTRAFEPQVGSPSARHHPAARAPRPFAGPRLMRPSTIRHPKLAVRPRSHTRRTTGILVAAGSLGALAVACDRLAAPSRDTVATATVATASPMIARQNEACLL